MRIFALIGVAFLLTACGGAQNFAGINKGTVAFTADGKPQLIEVIGGKEQSSVSLNGTLADGTSFEYSASDVKAFEGQAVRAAVEQALITEVGAAAPNVVQAIIDALVGL